MPDVISTWIKCQYDRADKNRYDLNKKWEDNRSNFQGNLFSENDDTGTNTKWKKDEGEGWRSKTHPGATHQKVISALAIVLDTMLSGGSIPFMLKPSPFNKHRVRTAEPIDPKAVEKDVEFMSDLIDQQFSDCKAELHFTKNCLSAALYAWTYAKMVVKPIKRSGYEPVTLGEIEGITDWNRINTPQEWRKWEESFNAPHWQYIPVWDIFRDWETDDLTECGFIIHRQIVNNWWLRQKKSKPFFIDDNLDKAIARVKNDKTKSSSSVNSNEDTSNMSPALRNFVNYRVNTRQCLEYWGRIPRDIVEEFEKDNSGLNTRGIVGDGSDDGDEVEVCAISVEGEDTIRFVRTTPDMRPFSQAKWEDIGDEFMPRGVADNCQEMQTVIQGTIRGIEDNVKLAGNVILAIKERLVKNMPKSFKPGTRVLLAEECQKAGDAIQQITIADMSSGLMGLLNLAKTQMEEDSMVPKIAQGMVEAVGQTAREVSIRQAQALKYLGMAIRNIDTGLIEPMVKMFYDYNMEDPEVKQGKGNYLIQALGFSSFQNKNERLTKLMQALTLALAQPKLEAETKIRQCWEEIIKAMDVDPDMFLKTQEEKDKEQEEAMNNPALQLEMEGQKAVVEKDKAAALKDRTDAALNLAQAKDKTVDTDAKTELLSLELGQPGQADVPADVATQPPEQPEPGIDAGIGPVPQEGAEVPAEQPNEVIV